MYKTRTERRFHELSYQFAVSVMADVTAYIVKKWIDKHWAVTK